MESPVLPPAARPGMPISTEAGLLRTWLETFPSLSYRASAYDISGLVRAAGLQPLEATLLRGSRCWPRCPGIGLWPVTARQPVVHRSLLQVEAKRRVGGWISVKTRYFISSHPPEARHLLAMARTHWSIETGLHWVLDVAFREDARRVRPGHAPVTCACCGAWRSTCSSRTPPVKDDWLAGAARPAANSPTWSKSWVSHNLAMALAPGENRWHRSCSIIDALRGCSAPPARDVANRFVQVLLEPDRWCADFPHGRSRLTGKGPAARCAAWKL